MKPSDKYPFSLSVALITVFITCCFYNVMGQLTEDENIITNTFRNSIHINTPTTTIPKRYGFEFQLRHRFGEVKPDEAVVNDFLGTDLTANIQFGFAFPFGNNTMAGIQRTKAGKTYTLHVRRIIVRQRVNEKFPVSVVIYADASVSTAAFRKVTPNTFFEDSITPFENKFSHRLTYNTQLLISRKFGERFSLQVSPAFIYRNLVAVGEDNQSFVIPVSGAVRMGTYSSLLLEFAWKYKDRSENKLPPISIGYEFGTAGHVFQITACSSPSLLESSLYTSEQSLYTKGEFYLGFNMKRTFWHKKKIKRLSIQNK